MGIGRARPRIARRVLLAVTGGSGLRHLIVAVIVVELALAVWAVFAAVRAYASLSGLWSQRMEAALAGPLPRRIDRLITLELSLARGVWLRWGGRPDLPIGPLVCTHPTERRL